MNPRRAMNEYQISLISTDQLDTVSSSFSPSKPRQSINATPQIGIIGTVKIKASKIKFQAAD